MSIRTRWGVAIAAVVVVAAGVTGGVLWWNARHTAAVGELISLGGGEVTFHAPSGWLRRDCPSAAPDCLELHPPGDSGQDSIVAMLEPENTNAPEGDVSLMLLEPGVAVSGNLFTVDGARFVRVPMGARTEPFEEPAGTMVLGLLGNGDVVRIACEEHEHPDVVRAGCEVVIGSLHVRT